MNARALFSRSTSPGWQILEAVTVACVLLVLLAVSGVDFGRQQSAIEYAQLDLILAGTFLYVAMSLSILWRRVPTRGDRLFIRCGMLVPLAGYAAGILLAALSGMDV